MGADDDDLGSLSDSAWRRHLAALATTSGGRFVRLGPDHDLMFVKGSSTVVVTFETEDDVRARAPIQLPLGLTVARKCRWSALTILARGRTWYRHPAVFAQFDRLADAAFFERFRHVVFYGAGMGGYAAAAYSVTAPGATVVAVQPQATLDPRIAGWDARFTDDRRLSFDGRYGFAPDMTEGAGDVFVLYDPLVNLDAMHAALYARGWSRLLPLPCLGRDVAGALETMGVLMPVLTHAGEGRLTADRFWQLYRARRGYEPYLKNLAARLDSDGRALLGAILARNVVRRLDLDPFRQRLADLEVQLAAAGVRIPPPRR
jgi:hypothetical protein